MLFFALNFLFGILLFSVKNTLVFSSTEIGTFLALLLVVLLTFRRQKSLAINLLFFIAGFSWMGLFSTQLLNNGIDEKHFNTPIMVTGTIADLPQEKPEKTQFTFNVSKPYQGKIKLTWYGQPPSQLKSGDQWQLLIKIKHNNGYQNEGGFDYEQWLFYQQFDATGYVKRNDNNQLLVSDKATSINTLRQYIREHLSEYLSTLEFSGVINALIIGDRSLISSDQWEMFKQTNTTHLSVISGLHIGLISGFVFLLVSFLWRHCYRCSLTIPASVIGAYFGLISALVYALIAGFSIPTQRAFIMAGVVFLSVIFRRSHNIWQLYGLALLLVLISNPLSVFSIGFWLSFYVVGVIVYGVKQHQDKHWLFRLLYIQLLISIATLPLIAWFFSSGSLLSPIANLVAIPVFSFVTTPFSLLGAIFSFAQLETLSQFIFSIANLSLVYLSILLNNLQSFEFNLWHYTPASSFSLLWLIFAVFIALLPKSLKLRKLAYLILLLIWLQPSKPLATGEVMVTTLDVGQGLSQVIRTKNHVLIFDTGAHYRSGFNMGEAVILPYLRTKRINNIDSIIISHGDNDHIGGLDSLQEKLSIDQILSSVTDQITHANVKDCNSAPPWQWDGVNFKMLNLAHNFTGNNASCVLKISNAHFSVLLTGDIEKTAERHLINIWGSELQSDVLISPHHGSKTSSSELFLSTVKPAKVIISSGYKNRFNHPATKIIKRYQQHNIEPINTACAGQIDLKLSDQLSVKRYRKVNQRYYWRQCD
ncbi:MAG: DNA internalization-related competence protein ComEC/Rec2 [Candidatus Thioglobus sp.]|uniref:DNA internalization-related competence protein ComEC/Rec2 n=1 Tax=Candidatus Thioglobus sp. TaxID=2026721 RepID=UPI00260B5A70|nr:DNA internalization-related competence protein ComEC/Rec2 [Candidatus Thioglobus sp.]MDC9726550.1 DNA internalization-related competence protein ComEC/Rec2 [Candidatus Thioglobus sp.]